MLDPKFIRNNPEKVKEIIKNKGTDPTKADVDKWLELDRERNELMKTIEDTNRRRNEIAQLLSSGNVTDDLKNEGKNLKQKAQELNEKITLVEIEWNTVASWFPNIPYKGTTVGKSDLDNPEIYAWTPNDGELPKEKLKKGYDAAEFMPKKLLFADKEFTPKHHLDILNELGMTDFAQGAKVSGTRFTYLLGDIVRLQLAIQNFIMMHLYELGFTPIIPPLLVKEKVLFGTSHFPEGRDQAYEVLSEYLEDKDHLFLVGSSEPSNFAFGMDKTFREEDLPLKMVAITPCFRTEVGSWGKDVRGLKRVHQFDKLEMDVICTQEQSENIYLELMNINKWLLQSLELPFHIVEKCTGDSGYLAASRQADPEVWLTGQQEFMEVMTDTNATDFQARRMNINYIDKEGNKKLCHTVNDTGAAMGRLLIAIIDNYQQSDGSIKVPQVLRAYMGKEYIGKKN